VSNELIKYAFTGGEISPSLYGRSDLEQYDLGVALAKNWFVDYRGGLSSRPGFEFCDFVMHDDKETKFFDFRFAPDLSNVYLLLFGDHYLRFIQDGSYVLEEPKTVVAFDGTTFTVTSHGFNNGDWIKVDSVQGLTNINGRTFRVANKTSDTFTLEVVPTFDNYVPSGTYISGGFISRIYTVATPWGEEHLLGLSANQRRDLLRLTHNDFPIYNLIRNGLTDWDLEEEVIGIGPNYVTGLTATASGSGNAGAVFAVTAVMKDGTETIMSQPFLLINSVNYTTTAGSVKINWNIFPGAVSYNIYRSIVVADHEDLTKGFDLGYIGRVEGTRFIDSNIIPDFTKTPPNESNPFASGAIEYVTVVNGGSGYGQNNTITAVDANGSGFLGIPIITFEGKITAVKIVAGGKNYVNPTFTIATSGGSGAVLQAELTEQTGNNPAISAIFQQRQMYAATKNQPLTVWGGKPGKYSNFSFGEVVLDSDSYEFEVDSSEISPLLHMIPMRGGLVLMSQTGIWQLSGGNSGVVTPTNALADPQTYNGVSRVVPIKVGPDIAYIEGKGFTVRLLSYNEYAKVYSGEDKSILSNHFFSRGRRLTSWAFAESPYKIIYGVRSDGVLLNFTIVKEEKVFAWTSSQTKGLFKDCRVVQENDFDRLYVMTRRKINGRWTKFIERMASREFVYVEDAFCVDCGLSLPYNMPNAVVSASGIDGEVTFTTNVNTFTPDMVGWVLRAAGGKAVVLSVNSPTEVIAQVVRPLNLVIPEDPDNTVIERPFGFWTIDKPVSELSGLWHLEGEMVSILADGNVQHPVRVVNGSVVLETPATRVHVGVPYNCVVKTLPPVVSDAVIEAKRKRVVGVAARTNDTVGLKTGSRLDNLYDAKERSYELLGEPIQLFSGIRTTMIEPEWADDGTCYFVQDNPLPATLLGLVFDIEVGDDTD